IRITLSHAVMGNCKSTKIGYDVFLNHRGPDAKRAVANLIFNDLKDKGFNVFLDEKSIQLGERIPETIEGAISKSSVHIAILTPNYAESPWCLNELCLMVNTGAPIIPVFYGIQPSDLRMKDEGGVYARALRMHQDVGKIDHETLEEWEKALQEVSYIKGLFFSG
ncbi:hypothetical protein KI387_040895, partial [Taxus chinensis]